MIHLFFISLLFLVGIFYQNETLFASGVQSYKRLLEPLSIVGATGEAFPIEVNDQGGIILGLPSNAQIGTVRELIPNPWKQISILFGKKLDEEDTSGFLFGSAIAVSTDRTILAIGDPMANGKIYVYKKMEDRWYQQGQALAGLPGEYGVGSNVALDSAGKTLVYSFVTRSSAAQVIYSFQDDKWKKEYTASIPQQPRLGSIAISGDGKTLIIASDNPSEVKVLTKDKDWSITDSITFPHAVSFEDLAVSDDGSIITFRIDYESSRYLRVLQKKDGKYDSSYLPIQVHGDLSKMRLSNDGEMIVLGEPASDHFRVGRVRVFTVDGVAVNVIQTLHGRTPYGKFGAQVAISPDKRAIAVLETHASQSKSLDRKEEIYVYEQFQ